MQRAATIKDQIKAKVNPQYRHFLSIAAIILLGLGSILRFLYTLGIGPEGAGFNLFFFISSVYLISFVSLLWLVEMEKPNEYTTKAKVYFNFLNSLVGRGLFIIFCSLILVEKSDQNEVLIAIFAIIVGGINVVLGWD